MNRTWTLELPWTKPPISMNSRNNWRVHARAVKNVRYTAWALAKKAGIPALARISIELHYAPRDNRRRDAMNLVATLKPLEDGIVDARVIPDDTPDLSIPTPPVIDPPTGAPRGRLYVIIREQVQP